MKKNLFATLSFATLSAFVLNTASSFAVEPCTFYLKLDGGLSMSPKAKYDTTGNVITNTYDGGVAAIPPSTTAALPTSEKAQKGSFGPQFGGEVGYYWNEALSTGFKVAYISDRNKDKIKKDTDPDTSTLKTPIYLKRTSYIVALTLNYDFNNSSDFVPFIGVEAGAAINRYKVTPIKTAITLTELATRANAASGSTSGTGQSTTKTEAKADIKKTFSKSIGFETTQAAAGNNTTNNTPTATTAATEFKSKTRVTPHLLGKVGVGYNVSDNVRLTLEGKVSLNGRAQIIDTNITGQSFTVGLPASVEGTVSRTTIKNYTRYTKKPNVDFGVGVGVQFFM